MKKLSDFLNFKLTIIFILLICAQQIIFGISTYYLGLVPQDLQNKNILLFRFIVFFGATLGYFAFVILIRKYEISNQTEIYKNIFQSYLNKYKGSPAIWIQKNQKESFQISLGFKIFQSASGLFLSSTELFRYLLGFIIESIAISYVLEIEFIYAILLSFTFSAVVTVLSQKSIEQLSIRNSRSENNFFSFLNYSWDYLFLKNDRLQEKYTSKLNLKYSCMQRNLSNMYISSEAIVFINSLLVLLPIIIFDLYLALETDVPQSKILALIPMIPRQMAMANNVRAFGQMVTFFKMDLVGFKMNLNFLEIEKFNLEEKINISQITLNVDRVTRSYSALEVLFNELRIKKQGRITISGQNGAGKSMLLLKLHDELQSNVYLPAQLPIFKNSLSTGQAHRKNIEQFLKFKANVFLLDEWDANLDAEVVQSIDKQIDQLSLHSLVIEVRHFID